MVSFLTSSYSLIRFGWLLSTTHFVAASTGRPGHGFIGYGISLYIPTCAHACRDSIDAPLNCSTVGMSMRRTKRMSMGGASSSNDPALQGDGWMVIAPASGECMCDNDFYLQTLAYCLSTRCLADHTPVFELEKFWHQEIPGRQLVQPVPRVTYQQALANITEIPARLLNNSVVLNYTAVVPDELWVSYYNAESEFELLEDTHERYGLVVFLSGAVIPIGVSAIARLLPWPAWLLSQVHAYLIDPPVLGTRHASPLPVGFIVPTRGQALFIAYIWLISIVLCSVQYFPVMPNAWYPSLKWQMLANIGNRFGILSFANLPLVALYAGRNNVLLWLTNWSHSTFLLLHKWLAFLCMLEAVIHSLIYLYVYTHAPGDDHATESKLPYWYWGIIATLSLAVMIPASSLQIRETLYSHVFLPSHIVLAIFALVGCYLHIYFQFQRQWGYETWIMMAGAIWAFDRVVRVLRVVRAMISGRTFFGRAYVSGIDDDYYRLDIVPGIPGSVDGYLYLHFPTVSKWRFWESHPFSIPGINHGDVPHMGRLSSAQSKDDTHHQMHHLPEIKADSVSGSDAPAAPNDGPSSSQANSTTEASASVVVGTRMETTTLFVRKTANGLTSLLVSHTTAAAAAASSAGLRVLIEPSYGKAVTLLQDGQPGSSFVPSDKFANVLCVAGGVGITAVIPVLNTTRPFASATDVVGSKKVYWGVRTFGLVRAVEGLIGYDAEIMCVGDGEKGPAVLERKWAGDIRAVIAVGQRLDLRALLEEELTSPGQSGLDKHRTGTTVVVCGPPGMADEVRCIVAGLGRNDALVRLIVEDFSW